MSLLNSTVYGDGEPLVILHGLFGSSKNWQSHARNFGQYYQSITVDLRNHGQSFHAENMTYRAMSEDVARLLRHMELDSCRILGHSMGGKVAMMLAVEHPALVSSLLVADIAPVNYQHHYDDLINPVLALPLETINSRNEVNEILANSIDDEQLRAFLLQNLAREAGRFSWRVNWSAIQQEMSNITGFDELASDWSVDIPTLFLRGARSDYIGEAEIEEIRRHFSQVSIESIEDAGHWLHAEQPASFSSAAIRFFETS